MNRILLSDRALSQREIDLMPYLYNRKDLKSARDVARGFGLKDEAFHEILAAGLGPEPAPALVGGIFWYFKPLIPDFKRWLRKDATDNDFDLIAQIIRKYDTFGDHRYLDQGSDRGFVLELMGIE